MSKGKGEVILVRHGSTRLNKPGEMRGWLDVPLSPQGQKEALKAAQHVKERWPQAKRLYAGDLKRHKESAEFIAEALALEPEFRKELRPWDPGELAGHYIENLDDEIEYYVKHPTEAPKGGEPMGEFLERLLGFMSDVFSQAQAGLTPVICVTSIRDIEAILGWIDAGMRNDKIDPKRLVAKKETLKPGEIIRVSL